MCLIASVRLDPGLLQVSGQVEIDFLSRWNVYRMRPRLWATDEGIPVVLTKWVGVHSTDRDCAGKIMCMDAANAHRQADATSEMAIE